MTLNKILNHKPFIIAEIGSNWKDFADCLNSITLASQLGANAVKFQAFTKAALYGSDEVYKNSVPGSFHKPDNLYHGVLNLTWLPKLREHADACGIEFMCSAFSPELLDAVNPFVNIHKLASAEMCHLRMLEKLNSHGKPVIISTGAQTVSDITRVVEFTKDLPKVLMYCVAAYPAEVIDLRNISFLENHFKLPIGYSDHSRDVLEIPNSAVEAGACVIEKHVNLAMASGSPDAPHSLSPEDFKAMVDRIRCVKQMDFGPNVQEKSMITQWKRRILATRDIQPGDELIEGENFGIYRSLKYDTRAAHPFDVIKYQGEIAKVAIRAGDGIWIDDVG